MFLGMHILTEAKCKTMNGTSSDLFPPDVDKVRESTPFAMFVNSIISTWIHMHFDDGHACKPDFFIYSTPLRNPNAYGIYLHNEQRTEYG